MTTAKKPAARKRAVKTRLRRWVVYVCLDCGDRWPVALDEPKAEKECPNCGRSGLPESELTEQLARRARSWL